MIAARPWYDVFLLLYLALFFSLEAIFLIRETRLGWAMLTKCLFLGALFGYAGAATLLSGKILWCWCGGDPVAMALRGAIAVSLTWAIAELVLGNIRHEDQWPPAE